MKAEWLDSGAPITAETLARNEVLYMLLETEPSTYREPIDRVKGERGYVQEDVIELLPTTPNLDTLCAKFVDEHHHDDDEVRFVLEGEGIFDIRSLEDRWMRVKVEQGDLIVVPKSRHHRFRLTERQTIRCVRLFKDASGWVPHYRAERA